MQKSLIDEYINSFLNSEISLNEIAKVAFNIHLQINEMLQKKEDSRFLSKKLIKRLTTLINRNTAISYPIINLIPSILYKIDTKNQKYICKIIKINGPIECLIHLYHGISEIQLSKESEESFEIKIETIVSENRKYVSAFLNICIFLFESQLHQRWAKLIRVLFSRTLNNDFQNCILLLHTKRKCSKQLCSGICREIKTSESLLETDLYLLFILSSINFEAVTKTLKKLLKNDKCKEIFIYNYPLKLVDISELIDCFCSICSSLNAKQYIDEIARLIYESFKATQFEKIITFSLYNIDENNNLLDATIKAINICSEKDPKILVSNFPINILYTLNNQIIKQIIHPILLASVKFPNTLNDIMIYLRKMAIRPSRTEFAINSLCYIIKSSDSSKIQIQCIEILSSFLKDPLLRSKIFYYIASVKLKVKTVHVVSQMVSPYSQNLNKRPFQNLISEDSNGCIIANDFPGSTLSICLKNGHSFSEYNNLIDMYNLDFDESFHLPVQIAIRADAYRILAKYNEKAFQIFCEYFYIIDILSSPNESKIISDWCVLKLDREFLINSLETNSINNYITYFVIFRQLSRFKSENDSIVKKSIDIFNNTRILYPKSYQPLIKFIDKKIFSDVYIHFREELISFISLNVSPGLIDANEFIESMKNEIINYQMTSSHCQSYLKIFELGLNISSESSSALFSFLTSFKFTDTSTFAKTIDITISKTTYNEIFDVLNKLYQFAVSNDSIIKYNSKKFKHIILNQIMKWLYNYIKKEKNIDSNILQLIYLFFSLDEFNSIISRGIINIINILLKITVKPFKNYNTFDHNCRDWLLSHKEEINPSKYGEFIARLQLLSNKKNKNSEEPVNLDKNKNIFSSKWRGSSKWINEALMEEPGSDNYEDLIDFITEKSDFEEEEAYIEISDEKFKEIQNYLFKKTS